MLPALRHLASSEGSWSVAEWLLDNGSNINALDRFKRTPLEVRRLQTPHCMHERTATLLHGQRRGTTQEKFSLGVSHELQLKMNMLSALDSRLQAVM